MTLLRNVEVDGVVGDITFDTHLGAGAPEPVIDGCGGALLPGLHDHHLHLRALAAARASVDVRAGLDGLRTAAGDGWVRGIGAHDLTRQQLDAVIADRPVRVQHRSGHGWVLNSPALALLGLDAPDGLVVGDLSRFEQDHDLAAVGTELAGYGITAVTDATPGADADELGSLMPQRISVLRKVIAPAHEIAERVDALRPGPVAVHCATRTELVVALTVLGPGDRVEHAAVVPPELVDRLPTVVTQPGFIADRGDDYLRNVEPDDVPHLYRFRSLLEAGVPVCASSDAPYGPLDPWAVIRAARDRLTPASRILGADERVTARQALSGYLRAMPDGPETRVVPGVPADLVLLHVPLAQALREPSAEHVRHTWINGVLRR